MKFQRRASPEPEINLIPFIDVLLVVLIFLMLSTTYSKLTEMALTLPEAVAAEAQPHPQEIVVTVAADGRLSVNRQVLAQADLQTLSQALAAAASGVSQPMVIISADAQASHQSVMLVMEAARRTGLGQLSFAAQSRARD